MYRKIRGLGFELFLRGNVGWMNKSLGGLGKNTRDILKQEKKRKKKGYS